jgi:hypothetical protein
MSDLQCPFCIETRPSRARLVTHLDSAHSLTELQRAEGIRNARTVTDVPVDHPALAETPSPGRVDPDFEGLSKVPCICGANLVPLDDDRLYPQWTHQSLGNEGCKEAVPAAGMPTQQDRAELALKLEENNHRLKSAGDDMQQLREQLDAIDNRMAKLDADLTRPSVVRRATLNQVWDRLIDQGHMAAASVVMKMINGVVD